MTTQQFPAQSPLNIRNPGNREGEYFDLDSLYMITLESCDADRQLLYHTLATPGYYLSRSCAVGSLLPSMRPPHQHKYIELVYILKGQMTQQIEDFQTTYMEGGCCILNKNMKHVEICSSDFEAVFLLISDQFIRKAIEEDFYYPNHQQRQVRANFLYQALLEFQKQESFFKKEYLDFIPKQEPAAVRDRAQRIFASILLETRLQEPGFLSIVSGQLARLFSLLSDPSVYRMKRQNLKSSKEEFLFNRIHLYLLENHGRVDYAKLEKAMNYTRDYLYGVVKKRSGMTLVELGQQICLEEAADMLIHTDKGIGHIIQEAGYVNRTYFYRIFQEKYGMTPLEYRKHNARSEDIWPGETT